MGYGSPYEDYRRLFANDLDVEQPRPPVSIFDWQSEMGEVKNPALARLRQRRLTGGGGNTRTPSTRDTLPILSEDDVTPDPDRSSAPSALVENVGGPGADPYQSWDLESIRQNTIFAPASQTPAADVQVHPNEQRKDRFFATPELVEEKKKYRERVKNYEAKQAKGSGVWEMIFPYKRGERELALEREYDYIKQMGHGIQQEEMRQRMAWEQGRQPIVDRLPDGRLAIFDPVTQKSRIETPEGWAEEHKHTPLPTSEGIFSFDPNRPSEPPTPLEHQGKRLLSPEKSHRTPPLHQVMGVASDTGESVLTTTYWDEATKAPVTRTTVVKGTKPAGNRGAAAAAPKPVKQSEINAAFKRLEVAKQQELTKDPKKMADWYGEKGWYKDKDGKVWSKGTGPAAEGQAKDGGGKEDPPIGFKVPKKKDGKPVILIYQGRDESGKQVWIEKPQVEIEEP